MGACAAHGQNATGASPYDAERQTVNAQRKSRRSGLTLSELLVVLSIISVMAVVAIPTFARLGVFSRNELNNTARTVHSMLKAARIYASTYRVNTAVVYVMDNEANLNDSVMGEHFRILRAAALMYALPTGHGDYAGDYVSMNRPESIFEEFPGRMAIPLAQNVEYPDGQKTAWKLQMLEPSQISQLGLTEVKVWLAGGPYNPPGIDDAYKDLDDVIVLPAHVFTPSGQMVATGKERFEVLVTAPLDSPLNALLTDQEEQRYWYWKEDLDRPGKRIWYLNIQHIPLELFRATGRAKISQPVYVFPEL